MLTALARSLSCAAALLVSLAAPCAYAQSEEAVTVKDYDVFVDLPSAFAFIKLPAGWKFIGKLDTEQLRHLPPGTLTSLLRPDDSSTRLAAGEKTSTPPGKT